MPGAEEHERTLRLVDEVGVAQIRRCVVRPREVRPEGSGFALK
jgi:hypothetical protein